MDNVELL